MAKAQKPSRKSPQGAFKSSWKRKGVLRPTPRADGKGKARATTTVTDVYEDLPQKVRRSALKLDVVRHKRPGQRRAVDADDEGDASREGMERLHAQLLGADEDDVGGGEGAVPDGADDEEIESDDAFDEGDAEAFAGSAFARKAGRLGRGAVGGGPRRRDVQEVDLDEEDGARDEDRDEDEGMEEGEFFDVLDVLDGRADAPDERDASSQTWSKDKTQDGEMGGVHRDDDGEASGPGSEDDESDGEEAEDDELQISASDMEDESPEALAELENFLSALDPADTKKRKQDQEPVVEVRTKKRRVLPERTEAGEESEFGVRDSGTLNLEDLLAPLASTSAFAALKKSTKPLTSSSAKTKTLPAPLPQRAQERLDREAAYEQTKNEIDKWSATMKRIKEAEHLSFPLQAQPADRVSTLGLAAKFQPSNELESAVDKLLKSARLRDDDIAGTEALKMAHLSVEEVAARRAELRAMRELVFRADHKAKRLAKIKSKAYRRLRKKQRERLDVPNDAGDDGLDDEARMKAEAERALERATLRHRTTGKWAQAMKGREGLDKDERQAISEMLERGEKLRRRIRGEESSGESDGDGGGGGGGSSDEEAMDEEEIRRRAFEELEALRAGGDDGGEGEDEDGLLQSKSVFKMKFMRDAAARKAREADERAEELTRELAFGVADEMGGGASADAGAGSEHRTGGRMSFRPGASAAAAGLKPLGSLASDTSSVTLQSADLLQDVNATPTTVSAEVLHSPTPTPIVVVPAAFAPEQSPPINPWLVPLAPAAAGKTRKKNEAVVHKDASALAKSANRLKKHAAGREEERERVRDDAVLEIDLDKALVVPDPAASSGTGKSKKSRIRGKGKKAKAKAGAADAPGVPGVDGAADDDGDSDANSEVEEQERALESNARERHGRGVKAFQQRELVALAFAGDNVVQAFEEAKRQEAEADAPRQVDTTLPGWGSWGGTGLKKPAPKPHLIKTIPGVDPSQRADAHKGHVIISERRDKKAARYLVADLPYPYTSHAQFERRMEAPIGTEWNTRIGFQRGTMPRVVKKMGAVIDPLEKVF